MQTHEGARKFAIIAHSDVDSILKTLRPVLEYRKEICKSLIEKEISDELFEETNIIQYTDELLKAILALPDIDTFEIIMQQVSALKEKTAEVKKRLFYVKELDVEILDQFEFGLTGHKTLDLYTNDGYTLNSLGKTTIPIEEDSIVALKKIVENLGMDPENVDFIRL